MEDVSVDLLVVGAGAAGMMAALAARGAIDRSGATRRPGPEAPRVLALNATRRLGLKILVSGGGRCNVTNARVTAGDFDCDAPHTVRGILRGFPTESVQTFFEGCGVPLYEEPTGKLFPRSDDARDILNALTAALTEADVPIVVEADVVDLRQGQERWAATCADGRVFAATRVIVATGGRSLPKTGSRGFGTEFARRAGHSIAPELPALTPVWLDPGTPLAGLAGITHPALLTLAPRGLPAEQIAGARFRPLARSAGSLLITHRGISGPAALDVSGACALVLHEAADVELVGDFWALSRPAAECAALFRAAKAPGACLASDRSPRPTQFDEFLDDLRELGKDGRAAVATVLARALPRALADALLLSSGLDPLREARQLGAAAWREVHAAVTRRDLCLVGVAGYDKAEVTRGGVVLAELHRNSLESRLHPGLYFCGEAIHCTGRLGGFNFQWAWSSGFTAGAAAGAVVGRPGAC